MSTYLFDVESDGLLKELTRIHCLVIRDAETRETFRFRHNDQENTIAEGVEMLANADKIVGHNIVRFDILAIQKVFTSFMPKGEVLDTLVLCRMIAPDIKHSDFRLVERRVLPGQLIGSHSLDAWGYRVGLHKGSYAKDMLAAGKDPWATWNQEMEDYCVNDVDVTEVLWALCQNDMPAAQAVALEHDIHDLAGVMEDNGFPFDKEAAETLVSSLEADYFRLTDEVTAHFGIWFAPEKVRQVRYAYDDPKGVNKARTYKTPRPEFGEDLSRAFWGEVTVPKITRVGTDKLPPLTEGVPFCRIVKKEFNPQSRAHIVDRFVQVYNWEPTDFTDEGNVSVDDDILETLDGVIPMAKQLAEIQYLKKRIGQIKTGKNSWFNSVKDDGKIHGALNTCGAVSSRATHSWPNMGQVPGVIVKKGVGVLKGREGKHGWECRKLFYVPASISGVPWCQVGIDLSGIELRCLAEECAPFDDGELIDVVLNGDIHDYNMSKTGITQREVIKRVIYGLMYGAGDRKLGIIVEPLASEQRQIQLGRELRAVLMKGLPALKKAIAKVQAESEKGWILGLDGRKLKSRSKHSALNLRLQGNAAIIAKKWVLLTDDYLQAHGLRHGWNGDYALMAFVHDEEQFAVKQEHAELVSRLAVEAAQDAGLWFDYRCPIDAKAKIGHNWGDTH